MLIAPTEPAQLHAIGTTSSAPERFGADILIPGSGFLIGVQRKEFPGDFLSSLSDNRLTTLAIKLQAVPMRVLLLEGTQRWSDSGHLIGHKYGQGSRFTRQQLRGLTWSLHHEFGIVTYHTDDISDTVQFLQDLQRWALKTDHTSLLHRAGPVTDKMRLTPRDWGVYLLQGFEGVGPKVAGAIYDHFGRVPFTLDVTDKQLLTVPGLGKVRVRKIRKALS